MVHRNGGLKRAKRLHLGKTNLTAYIFINIELNIQI